MVVAPVALFPQEGTPPDFQRADRFLQRRLERSVDGHGLAGGLHLGVDGPVGGGELVEGPARKLHNQVIEGWLERGRRLSRNRVGDLVEALPYGDFGGYPRDWIPGRFGRQRGRAADAWVDLDHRVGMRLRIECV